MLCLNVAAIEKPMFLYGIFETAVNSKSEYSNPFDFTEISFSAEFISSDLNTINVSSFYDGLDKQGKDLWKIRFMPNKPGLW